MIAEARLTGFFSAGSHLEKVNAKQKIALHFTANNNNNNNDSFIYPLFKIKIRLNYSDCSPRTAKLYNDILYHLGLSE